MLDGLSCAFAWQVDDPRSIHHQHLRVYAHRRSRKDFGDGSTSPVSAQTIHDTLRRGQFTWTGALNERAGAEPDGRSIWSRDPYPPHAGNRLSGGATRFDRPRSIAAAMIALPASKPTASGTTRYFIHKLPIAVVGEPPAAAFVCLVTDTTGPGLEQFLTDHRRLFASLPAWTVVAASPGPVGLHACEAALQRYGQQSTPSVPAATDDLAWFFRA